MSLLVYYSSYSDFLGSLLQRGFTFRYRVSPSSTKTSVGVLIVYMWLFLLV
jgi:hypothetical protein